MLLAFDPSAEGRCRKSLARLWALGDGSEDMMERNKQMMESCLYQLMRRGYGREIRNCMKDI
jgi:hypothetical protein